MSSSRSLRSKKVEESDAGGQGGVVSEDPDVPGRSCQVCREEDTKQMVTCDVCKKRHHYRCVGVTQEIEKQLWRCAKCDAATGIQDPNSIANKHPSQHGSQREKQHTAVPKSSSAPEVQQKGSQLVRIVKSTGNKPIPAADRNLPRKPASTASGSSSRSSHALLKLKLQRLEEERELERRQAAEESAKEKAFLEKKYQLLEEMVSEGGSNAGSPFSRVEEWVDETANPPKTRSDKNVPRDHSRRNGSQQNSPLPPIPREIPNQTTKPAPQPLITGFPTPEEGDLAQCPLTRKQLAARQAISKELPTFSGNSEEWPLFLSSFNSTTAMCGFSDAENIFRLQRSLKGRAYEAVKSRLMHPSNVSGVISTLKMLFGQPEAIVHTLIAKINSLPPLKEDKLETLVDFAVSVENFCALWTPVAWKNISTTYPYCIS